MLPTVIVKIVDHCTCSSKLRGPLGFERACQKGPSCYSQYVPICLQLVNTGRKISQHLSKHDSVSEVLRRRLVLHIFPYQPHAFRHSFYQQVYFLVHCHVTLHCAVGHLVSRSRLHLYINQVHLLHTSQYQKYH